MPDSSIDRAARIQVLNEVKHEIEKDLRVVAARGHDDNNLQNGLGHALVIIACLKNKLS